MTRQGTCVRVLLVVCVLCAASWGMGEDGGRAGGARPLGVVGAAGDTEAGLLTIHGHHLLPVEGELQVKLAGQLLEVVSATSVEIQALLPAGLVPGTYLLEVLAGPEASWAAPVAVGEVADGSPPGPVLVSLLRVREARADLVAGTLHLWGESLGTSPDTTPTVTLSDVPLVVVSADEVSVLAQLPAPLDPGAYRVRVVRTAPGGTASVWTDAMDVTTVAGDGLGDITAVETPAGGGLQGGVTSGEASLGLLSCGSGQVLKSDGSTWSCAADADTDTGVDAVVDGGGITGSIAARTLTLGSTATPVHMPNAIVARDAVGSFRAGTLGLDGNLELPNTIYQAMGVFTKGGTRFLHNYGSASTFVGSAAGNFTVTGPGNSGFGYQALTSTTYGANNSAFGNQALDENTQGSSNSAFGNQALSANTTGSFNAAFGGLALEANLTGYENSAFGVRALRSNTTGNLNSAFGSEALDANTTGTNNSAFGYQALDANTTGPSNSAFGYQALKANTAGGSNAAFGYRALTANTTSGSSAFGYEALQANTTGPNNSAFGYQALYSNTTAGGNSAFGIQALRANTTGSGNSALGFRALYANTTGADNTAFGSTALGANTTGYNNAAFGPQALGANTGGVANVAFGNQALGANTTGIYNSAFGYQALVNSTGNRSTAIGYWALRWAVEGYNIAVGAEAGANLTNGSNNIYIGHPGVSTETGAIHIGDTQGATYVAGIYGQTSSSGLGVYVHSSGKLGTTTSSRRYKDEIADMDAESDVLLKLRPVSFYYRKELDDAHLRQYGLVAEEVAEVAPDLVAHDEDGAPQAVRYHFVNAMLLNEVQKQRRRIEEQEEQLRAQEAAIHELRASLARLEARLQ